MEGVRRAVDNGTRLGWDEFASNFGMYYADSIVFGGRVAMQHSYQRSSMSLFTSMGLDIKTAAKCQFANFFHVNATAEIERYQNQARAI